MKVNAPGSSRLLEIFLKEARTQNQTAETLSFLPGKLKGTMLSVMVQTGQDKQAQF